MAGAQEVTLYCAGRASAFSGVSTIAAIRQCQVDNNKDPSSCNLLTNDEDMVSLRMAAQSARACAVVADCKTKCRSQTRTRHYRQHAMYVACVLFLVHRRGPMAFPILLLQRRIG